VAGAPKKRLRPNNILLKVEANTKVGLLKLQKGRDPDNFVTAIEALEIEYRNNSTNDDKMAASVSVSEPQYGATILNKMEKLKNAEGEEVTCDALVDFFCVNCGGSVDLGRVSSKIKLRPNWPILDTVPRIRPVSTVKGKST
jgi:hypothetical protein